MGKASADHIKEGIQIIVAGSDFSRTYKNVDNDATFNTLCSTLGAWLEEHDYGDLDKERVAQVINQHFTTFFSFGPRGKKIGPFSRDNLTPLIVVATAGPVYTDLTQGWNADSSEYRKVRRDVARVLGIDDAGHTYHRGNYAGTETLSQIIQNLTSKVQGRDEVQRVRNLVRTHYNLTLS